MQGRIQGEQRGRPLPLRKFNAHKVIRIKYFLFKIKGYYMSSEMCLIKIFALLLLNIISNIFANFAKSHPALLILGNIGIDKNWQK